MSKSMLLDKLFDSIDSEKKVAILQPKPFSSYDYKIFKKNDLAFEVSLFYNHLRVKVNADYSDDVFDEMTYYILPFKTNYDKSPCVVERYGEKANYEFIYISGMQYGNPIKDLTEEIVFSNKYDVQATLLGDYKEWTFSEIKLWIDDHINDMAKISEWRFKSKRYADEIASAIKEPDFNSISNSVDELKKLFGEIFKV